MYNFERNQMFEHLIAEYCQTLHQEFNELNRLYSSADAKNKSKQTLSEVIIIIDNLCETVTTMESCRYEHIAEWLNSH
jgi:hypothetical protein